MAGLAPLDRCALLRWDDDGGAPALPPWKRPKRKVYQARARARNQARLRVLRIEAGRNRRLRFGPDGKIEETWR